MYSSTEVGNYINLVNVTINGEADLGTKEINYPEDPKNGIINTRNIIIPEPYLISKLSLIKLNQDQLNVLSSHSESNMKIIPKMNLNDNK